MLHFGIYLNIYISIRDMHLVVQGYNQTGTRMFFGMDMR